MSHFNAKMDQI